MSLIERAAARLPAKPDVDPMGLAEPSDSLASSRQEPVRTQTQPIGVPPTNGSSGAPAYQESPGVGISIPAQLSAASTAEPAGAPVAIDMGLLRSRHFVTPGAAPGRLNNEMRVIKRPLLDNAFGPAAHGVKNGRRVMVTSALPGEGKTFCAVNLAMSIAIERDHSVLLVDADVAHPSVFETLGIPRPPRGLLDWLVAPAEHVSDLVLQTSVERLSVMSAGKVHEHSTELLASGAMSMLLEQLSTRFPDKIIIFDSPPLLPTTESRVLASYMGQIVVVVEASRTPQETVAEALATVRSCEVIGTLLNKVPRSSALANNRYSGYGYGYGHASST